MALPDERLNPESVAWLGALFEPNVDAVFNVAYRLVWNRADAYDVVQNAFVKAARASSQLLDPSRARSWLLSIAYREALMVLRSRRDVPTDPVELPNGASALNGPEDAALDRELAMIIQQSIALLPETLRLAFVLRDVEELPMIEVAEVLDIGVSAAKMRVARARETLRSSLTGRI